MAKLQVLEYPNPNLRLKAQKVEEFNQEIVDICADMLETMYVENGIGLAATQVDIQKEIIVMDISKENDQPICLINPEIIETRGEEVMEEGCLSVPGIYAEVTRAEWVRVKAMTPQGDPQEMETDGLLAVCIQHEIDHLQGKLFVDYLSPAKRQRVLEKLKSMRANGEIKNRESVPYAVV